MSSVNLSELLPPAELGFEEKLQTIFSLSDAGYFLFPACGIKDGQGTCGRKGEALDKAGKHPIDGAGITKATRDKSVLERYFKLNQVANIAIYCRQSGLLVVDIDPRNGGDVSWGQFIERYSVELPATVEVHSGQYKIDGKEVRGTHLYFQVSGDGEFIGSLNKFGLTGVDIKYNGYVIAPPSRHFSGTKYEFAPGLAPWQIQTAQLPLTLHNLLASDGPTYASQPAQHVEGEMAFLATCSSETTAYGLAALKGICSEMAECPEGNRNTSLFKLGIRAASLVAGGEIAYNEMRTNLLAAARQAGLQDDEIEQVLFRTQGAFEMGARQPSSAPNLGGDLSELVGRHSTLEVSGLDPLQIDLLKRLNVVDLEDIFRYHEPEKWYVPGFICSGRGHAFLSESGVGKSLLMREVCAKLALGESIWGNPAQAPLRILYLDYENDPVHDIGATLKAMNLDAADSYEGRLTFLSYPDIGNFDTDQGAADMEKLLEMFNPDLVVIDTLSRVVEGEENSNDTWLKFYKSVGLVLKRRAQTYVRIDHLGKNTDKGARGGSAKSGDIDLIWTMSRRSGKGELFDVVNSKSRTYLEKKSFVVERRVSPLEHIRIEQPEVDWGHLLGSLDKQDELFAWFAELEAKGSFSGQKAMWAEHKEALQKKGISYHAMNNAHREFKTNIELASRASK